MRCQHLKVSTMNIRNLLNSRSMAAGFAAILYVGGASLAQFLGLDDPTAGFFADPSGMGSAGLLLVWAVGHCDGMDGPVVVLAKKALETGNVNLVLPWVRGADDAEIRRAFDHASAVRKLGPQARELADMHFFETLVRIHRAGEGAPYTGLKPAGRDLGPVIPAADKALRDGSIETVVKLLADAVRDGVHRHYHAVMNHSKFDQNDVEAGRAYVEAYVPYIHFVERLFNVAKESPHGHFHAPEKSEPHMH